MKFLAIFLTTIFTALPAAAQNIPNGSVVNSKVGFNIKNYAQNAEFRFYQRQVPATLTNRQDDAYGPDRWYMLTSGGAVNTQTARVAEIIASSPTEYVGQFRQADATPRQFGNAQILETSRVLELRGKAVRLGFWARTDGTEITTLRACIGEWTGTANTVTSDIVSSWAATPTWIGNFSCANTPADITISSTMSQYTVSATLGSTFNNLVLFIWTPNSEAQNDDYYLTQVQLVQGNSVLSWPLVQISYDHDLQEAQRRYGKSYDLDTAPGTVTLVGAAANNNNNTASVWNINTLVPFKVTMGSAPSVTIYNPNASNTTGQCNIPGVANYTGVVINAGLSSFVGQCQSVGTNGNPHNFHWTADAEL